MPVSETASTARPPRTCAAIVTSSSASVALSAFSTSASRAWRRRSSSARTATGSGASTADLAAARGAPSPGGLARQAVQRDRGEQQRVGVPDGAEHQQLVGDPPEAAQLVEHDRRVVVALGPGLEAAAHELGVPLGDRQRRAQRMRGVAHEAALALGDPALLVDGVLAPAHVPDHAEEHARHERDLGQLGAVDRVAQHRDRRDRHHREQDARGLRVRPPAEAVEERDRDPDPVERDRLPLREDEHADRAGHAERAPRDLAAVVTARGHNPGCGPSG